MQHSTTKEKLIKKNFRLLAMKIPSGLVSGKFERKTEPTQQEIDMLVKEAEDKKVA